MVSDHQFFQVGRGLVKRMENITKATPSTKTQTTKNPGLSKDDENLMIIVLAITFLMTWIACLGVACKRRYRQAQQRRAQRLGEHNLTHQYDPPTYKVALGMPKPEISEEFVVRDENGIHVVIVEQNGEVCETSYSMSRETPQVQESHHVFHFGEYSGLSDAQQNVASSNGNEPRPQTSRMADATASRHGKTSQTTDLVSHSDESQGKQIIGPKKGRTLEAAIRAHAIPVHGGNSRDGPHNLRHPHSRQSPANRNIPHSPGYSHVRDSATPIGGNSHHATESRNTPVWVVSSLLNSTAGGSTSSLPDYNWAVEQCSHTSPVHPLDCTTHL